jgi:DNA-binding transcriptional LysR family regulator
MVSSRNNPCRRVQEAKQRGVPSIDLDAVRTFIKIVDLGQFHEAATELSITQQAVSKRIAGLERTLGVQLFVRTGRGVQLTIDGQAFNTHARNLLEAEQRAANSVRPGRRALRVDIINPRIAPAHLLHDFHRDQPELELDVITSLLDLKAAIPALVAGQIDASFRAINTRSNARPAGLDAIRVFDEPLQILTGPRHKLANRSTVSPAELSAHKIWMPSLPPGAEWSAYYDDLATDFGFSIDKIGPNFGIDSLLDTIANSSNLMTFVGDKTRLVWPPEYDLRRIPLQDPTPIYPHSLLWRKENPHPSLTRLRDYLIFKRDSPTQEGERTRPTWEPSWSSESKLAN